MLHSQPNAFQRQTDLLQIPEVRQQILLFYRASEAMAHSCWSAAIQQITKYKQLTRDSRLEKEQNLELQLQLMKAFCLFKLKNYQTAEQIVIELIDQIIPQDEESQQKSRSFSRSQNKSIKSNNREIIHKALAVRMLTFAAQLIICQDQSEIDPKEIKKLLTELLSTEQMKQFLPEVLGTLTGCKYFKPLIALKKIEGVLDRKKAKKMQVLGDWKWIAGLQDEALEFKKQASEAWQQLNCHKQLTRCHFQINQLKKKNKTQYYIRLSRIKVFATPLIQLEPQLVVPQNSQVLIKWSFPPILSEIFTQNQNEQEYKITLQKASMTNSNFNKEFAKKMMLRYVASSSESFYKEYKQEIGGEATRLMLNSKFLNEQIKKIRKNLAIVIKIRSLRLRDGWELIKKVAFPEKPVLKSQYLGQPNRY